MSFRQQSSGQQHSDADQKQNGASDRKCVTLSRCWSKDGINWLLPASLAVLLCGDLPPNPVSQVPLVVPS